jgi:hypothetical protein
MLVSLSGDGGTAEFEKIRLGGDSQLHQTSSENVSYDHGTYLQLTPALLNCSNPTRSDILQSQ